MKQLSKNIIVAAVILFLFTVLVTIYAMYLDNQVRKLNPGPVGDLAAPSVAPTK